MRHGGVPFRDVFSSQGPLFLPLIWLFDLVGLRTANAPRLLAVAAGLVSPPPCYAIGRTVSRPVRGAAGRRAGGDVDRAAGRVRRPLAADGPAMAFGAVGVALAIRWRSSPAVLNAVWMGVAVGGALSVKSLLVPAVVPVALVLLSWRRVGLIVAGALAAPGRQPGRVAAVGPGRGLGPELRLPPRGRPLPHAGGQPGRRPSRRWATGSCRWWSPPWLCVAWLLLGRPGVGPPRGPGASPTSTCCSAAGSRPPSACSCWSSPCGGPTSPTSVPAAALLVARHRPRWEVLAVAAVAVVPYHRGPRLVPGPPRRAVPGVGRRGEVAARRGRCRPGPWPSATSRAGVPADSRAHAPPKRPGRRLVPPPGGRRHHQPVHWRPVASQDDVLRRRQSAARSAGAPSTTSRTARLEAAWLRRGRHPEERPSPDPLPQAPTVTWPPPHRSGGRALAGAHANNRRRLVRVCRPRQVEVAEAGGWRR